VTAIDRDVDALASLATVPGITCVKADLEGAPWPLAAQSFDIVIVTNYLHRPLFPVIAAAVAPRGLLLYETFMRGNEAHGRPSNPDFLLAPQELWEAFGAVLSPLAFEQGLMERPGLAVIQRIAARRAPALSGKIV
jgi:SAM-dependent methyltransferase